MNWYHAKTSGYPKDHEEVLIALECWWMWHFSLGSYSKANGWILYPELTHPFFIKESKDESNYYWTHLFEPHELED